jgi:hypothetical protein
MRVERRIHRAKRGDKTGRALSVSDFALSSQLPMQRPMTAQPAPRLPVKMFLLIIALTTVGAEEAGTASMRQKLHAKILESAPPAAPPKPPSQEKDAEEPPPAVVMKPVVVSESKLVREVTAALDREKQNRQEERFSPLEGGKIDNIGPMQVGGWWTPDEGWTFLRLNKGRSPRRVQAAEATLKELEELAALAEDRRPLPKPSVTPSPSSRRPSSDR